MNKEEIVPEEAKCEKPIKNESCPDWESEYWYEWNKNAKLRNEIVHLRDTIFHLTHALMIEGEMHE